MFDKIRIHNFKSIVDMELPLGRFNVIIGPNGCGKTNILEAISMAGAAGLGKLDNEYLINRDIRLCDPKFMVNAFEENDDSPNTQIQPDPIRFACYFGDKHYESLIWYDESIKRWFSNSAITTELIQQLKEVLDSANNKPNASELKSFIRKNGMSPDKLISSLESIGTMPESLLRFLIYHPSEQSLRKTFESTLYPLGVHGEGSLKYLKDSAKDGNSEMFRQINDGLSLLDWFEGFEIPDDLMSNEYRLSISDRYLRESLHSFDQRSTNEGFLFLLFYLTLFNSGETPAFFAVDNIETALNPRLATRLTSYLVDRSFAMDKQVIVSTHSPFVLDGLDLSDDSVRLFVARRDIEGHTRIERVPFREDRAMPLSRLWMSGLIGGLPDNF